jgi:hypothetical protein
VSFLKAVWLSVRAPLAAAKARQLKADGSVQKAPNIALIEVGEGDEQKFKSVLPDLMAAFDRVVVAWKTSNNPPESSEKINIVAESTAGFDRWDLVSKDLAGFVFPMSLDNVHADHQIGHLKSHLFAYGGYSAVSCLGAEVPTQSESQVACASLATTLVDLDTVVFDQRFWRLHPGEIDGADENESFLQAAAARKFDLLACSQGSLRPNSSLQPEMSTSSSSANSTVRSNTMSEQLGEQR